MELSMLLEMAAEGCPERVASGRCRRADLRAAADPRPLTRGRAGRAATSRTSAMVDTNSEAVPLLVYAASFAGLPFVPLNYRLADAQLRAAVERIAPAVVVAPPEQAARFAGVDGITVLSPDALGTSGTAPGRVDDGGRRTTIAILLFTSGTSGEPKGAVLRPSHLVSYVLSTVEFLGAEEDEAILVSVPPYHIAGISTVLTSVYDGRRMVQLPAFSPEGWVELARSESDHARDGRADHARPDPRRGRGRRPGAARRCGTSPTAAAGCPGPSSSGRCGCCPTVDLVNAYGLTETSSTIAVLGPGGAPRGRGQRRPGRPPSTRLGRVARCRRSRSRSGTTTARSLPSGEQGEIFVRGEQVSGEYLSHRAIDDEGWFPTRDRGLLDAARLPLRRRPGRRRHRARGGEPLPGRDRGRPGPARRGRRGGRRRAARHRVGRARRRRRRPAARAGRATEERAPGLGARPAAVLQDPVAGPLPRGAAAQRDRQAPAPGAARGAGCPMSAVRRR